MPAKQIIINMCLEGEEKAQIDCDVIMFLYCDYISTTINEIYK